MRPAARPGLTARASLLWAPLAIPQGLWLKRRIPRLPEAPGARQGQASVAHPSHPAPLKLAALGESPLAGVGLANQAEHLLPALAARLAERYQRDVDWQISARNGATTELAHQRLLPALEGESLDLVLLGLGVNNSLRLDNARRWQQGLSQLVESLRNRFRQPAIILLGVPDMSRFPALPAPLSWLLGSRSRWLDQAAGELASQDPEVWHAPIPLDARFESLFASDGFHPSAEGHAAWAEALLPVAELALSGQAAPHSDP